MASVSKKPTDRARGKQGKWTCHYLGEDGKRKSKVGVTDKAESLRIANHLEEEARMIRLGLVDRNDRNRREASLRSVADHCEDYRLSLIDKGDTLRHCRHTANTVRKLLEDAGVRSIDDIAPDRIRSALGRMKAAKKSSRTCNFAIGAVKAFAVWLAEANRIEEVPRGLKSLTLYNEKEDRRRVRRALTKAEIDRLLEAAEAGAPVKLSRRGYQFDERHITGPERATLYRLAMDTGFRANEIRTLTPECFHLDGDEPIITLDPRNEKNRKGIDQPITRELAASLKQFVEGKPEGKPVLEVPEKTAKLLRVDLAAAGIPYADPAGRVVDFHSLRHSYITHLILAGVNPKIVQALARHSTITLTLDRYTHVENSDLRKALEGDRD